MASQTPNAVCSSFYVKVLKTPVQRGGFLLTYFSYPFIFCIIYSSGGRVQSTFQRLKKVFHDVVHDPATFIVLGSVFMSSAAGGIEAIVANILATTGIASLKAYESWTGDDQGRPFAALGVVNFFTSASIGYHTYEDIGLSIEAIKEYSLSAAYALWGVRSALLSLQERFNFQQKTFKGDPQFYQGLGTVATSGGQPIAAIFGALGVVRTLKQNDEEMNPVMMNVTAPRLYAAQYAVSIPLVALADESLEAAIAFGLWSWAFTRFDKFKNKAKPDKGVLLSLD